MIKSNYFSFSISYFYLFIQLTFCSLILLHVRCTIVPMFRMLFWLENQPVHTSNNKVQTKEEYLYFCSKSVLRGVGCNGQSGSLLMMSVWPTHRWPTHPSPHSSERISVNSPVPSYLLKSVYKSYQSYPHKLTES